jgi:hypothetical protein
MMSFDFNTGTIVVIAAIVIFYIRLIVMNILKAKREAKKTNIEIHKAIKKGKQPAVPEKPAERFAVQVRSWWGVAASVGLVLVGLAVNSYPMGLAQNIVDLWYIPVAAGILLLAVFIK